MDTVIRRLLIADDDKPMRQLLGNVFTRPDMTYARPVMEWMRLGNSIVKPRYVTHRFEHATDKRLRALSKSSIGFEYSHCHDDG